MTASAVKQTMVMLSDAVTTMMLLVVPLQESNAPMSQELPLKTQAVAHIASKISAVADGLAQDEYDAFPEIQKEMLDASSNVREQVGGLERAIVELQQGSNRKRGWDILVSSCASISTKTVLLLKIVYGVEIKRVMASAKSALAKVNAINPDEVNTNPQEFVNKLSAAATELDQLGEYMASKANDPDLSPEVQEQMRRAAEYQKQASENLIKAGNDLLQDRNNPDKKRALGDAIEDARHAIAAGDRPMGSLDEQLSNLLADQQPKNTGGEGRSRVEYDPQEMAYNIARSKQILEQLADPNNKEDPEELLRELEALLDKIKKDSQAAGELLDPKQQKAIAQLLEAVSREVPLIKKNIRDGKDISDSLNRLLQGLDQLGNMVAPFANKEQVAAELMKNDLERLEKAADNGDGDTATRCAKRVIENQKNLEGGNFGDGKSGEKQRENVNALSRDVPVDIRALKEVLNDPKPEKKAEFKKANEIVKADARQVGAYASPSGASDLDDLLGELQNGVRGAVEASKDGDPKKLQEETASINGARAKMQPAVVRSANASSDPARRRNEMGKWKDLNECLDDFMGALKGGDEIALERKREKVLDAIEDYRDATSLDPLAAAEDLRRSAADFVAASVKDDREKIPQEARNTQHAVSALHGPAQKAALRTRDPQIQERVGGDLDKLDKLVEELTVLGTENVEANNNRDAPAALRTAKEMNKKFDDIDNTVDDLTSALKPGVGKQHPDGPQSVEKEIPPHLRQLYAAAKELERRLPGVVGAAQDADNNPLSQAEKDAFAKALEGLEMPLRGIKAADSDENKAVALSKVLQDHIEDMSDASKKGEPNGVVSGARLASDTKGKLGPLLEDLASREQDPKKAQQIRDLAQQLENEFPKTIVAARNALQNPNDRQAQVELERAQEKVDNILEGLRSAIQKAPEEQCMVVKEDLQKSMEAILGFVAANRKRDAVQEARKVASTDLNPLKNFVHGLDNEDDLLGALDRLLELLKDMEEQTPKAADSPAGSQERKDLEDMVDQASKLLDKVVDESGAEALKAIHQEKRDLRGLHDDMSKEDPANFLKADVKGVVADHRNVLEKLRNEQPKLVNSNPTRAKELGEAIEEMEALMPQVIQKTKGVIVNPDDAAAQRELDEAVSTLEVPLAKSANAIAPSTLRDLMAKAKEIDRAGQSVASGTMTGDMAKSQKNSNQLNNLKPLKDAVDQRIHEMEKNNPVHAKELKDKMKEVEEAAKDVQRSATDPSKVGGAADKLSHKLKELEEAAEGSDVSQDVALAAAQKDDLLRALKGPLSAANKLSMNDLLKMAMDLSDSMGGMIGKVEEDVKRQGGGASVLDAINQLRELERRASEPIKAPKLEEKKSEPKVEEKPKQARPQPVAPAANADFHEKVKHMAAVIDVAADSASDQQLTSTAQGLSATLVQLAEAARKGDRMGILGQTKDAVADINRLVLVFKGIAEEITDRKMKDRMVWLSSMLKDVATNLKILCSVKAASGGPDNDDQIVSVITSVKNIFTEGLDLANIAEKTNKRKTKA